MTSLREWLQWERQTMPSIEEGTEQREPESTGVNT